MKTHQLVSMYIQQAARKATVGVTQLSDHDRHQLADKIVNDINPGINLDYANPSVYWQSIGDRAPRTNLQDLIASLIREDLWNYAMKEINMCLSNLDIDEDA